MALSTKASKPRKPIRLNTKKAKARRLAYAKRVKNPAYAAKLRKYRKAYYKKNRAALLKKRKATYKLRRDEFLKKRKAARKAAVKTGGSKPAAKKSAVKTAAKKAAVKKAASKKK